MKIFCVGWIMILFLLVLKLNTLHLYLGPNYVQTIYSLNLTQEFCAFIFCVKAFQILSPIVAKLLSPKVADVRAFTKISFGLALAFSFTENILFIKLGFRSFIDLNISKVTFLSLFISVDNFWLSFIKVIIVNNS